MAKSKKKKVALIIMDGMGIAPTSSGNAYALAKKPNLDKLFKLFPHTTLKASQEAVGLPKGQMGNSEVGHLNIGAGRIIYTGLTVIDKDIQEHKFEKNQAFLKAFKHVNKFHSKLHILGLVSDGGVHSSIDHCCELIKLANQMNIPTVLHCITDGRDTPPKSFVTAYWPKIDSLLKNCKNVRLGTIMSRYYAMDRDKNWTRSELAYQTLIGAGKLDKFTDPLKFIQKQFDGGIKSDEFLKPGINDEFLLEDVSIQNNDAVISFNYRPDRSRQIAHLIFGSKYYPYNPKIRRKNIFYVTMMEYTGIVPSAIAYPPITYKNVLGEVLSLKKLKQLRISETEKYAHVTFFFDGGKEITYPGETKQIIPSPKVATYDLQPAMSSKTLTKSILNSMAKYDVLIINYPNGDMVGHTANIPATIKAVQAVDEAIGKIYEKSLLTKTTLFITADHGNAEKLLDDQKKPFTAHTCNLVPFIVTDKKIKLNNDGALANIAPTILDYLNIRQPKEMDQKSLLKKK